MIFDKNTQESETSLCNPGAGRAASSRRAQGSHSVSLQGPMSLSLSLSHTHTHTHTHTHQGVEWGTMEGLERSFTDVYSHTHTGAQWHAYAHAHIHRQLWGAVNEPSSQASLSFLYHHSPLNQVLTEQTGAQLLVNEGHLDWILPVKYPQQPTDR